MIVVDSNVLLRYFLEDVPSQTKQAKELFVSGNDLFIPESVFAEVDFVLRKIYKRDRVTVFTCFSFLISGNIFRFPKVVLTATSFYQKTTNSFVDCIAASYAKKGKLATFDKKLLHQTKIKSYWE